MEDESDIKRIINNYYNQNSNDIEENPVNRIEMKSKTTDFSELPVERINMNQRIELSSRNVMEYTSAATEILNEDIEHKKED